MSTKRHTSGTRAVKKTRKPPEDTKSKRFPIRMRASVFEAGQIAAKQQNRSLASLMETLLILHLREHDLLPDDVQIEMRQLELRASDRSLARTLRGAGR